MLRCSLPLLEQIFQQKPPVLNSQHLLTRDLMLRYRKVFFVYGEA